MRKAELLLIHCLLLLLLLFSCSQNTTQNRESFKAVNGVLDLKNWNPEKTGVIPLNGEWKIKRIEKKDDDKPELLKPGYDDSAWDDVEVPGYWSKKYNSPYGLYVLRLTIINMTQTKDDDFGIFSGVVQTSFELYEDGKKKLASGKPEAIAQDSIPLIDPKYTVIENRDNTKVIALRVANYDDPIIGIRIPPFIGLYQAIQQYIWLIFNFIHILCLGIILMMCLFHFTIWLQRKKDRASLYFALSAFSIFFRVLAENFFLEKFFSQVPIYEIHWKIEFISTALGLLFFVKFCKEIFPGYIPKLIDRMNLAGTSASILFILVTTTKVYQPFFPPMLALLIFVLLWCVFSLVKAVLDKKWEALILMSGFALLAFIVIFMTISLSGDIFSSANKYIGFNYAPIGFVIVMLSQSIVFSIRFTKAYNTSEHLTKNLQKEVASQTQSLAQQRDELEAANTRLKDLDVQKTRFLENISHETKTPLTLVLGPIESILNGGFGEIPATVKKELSLILRNGMKLYHLLSQLIQLSKLDEGSELLRIGRYDIVRLLRFWVASFESLAKTRQVALSLDATAESVFVYCDVSAMETVFSNLISNALKFTQAGGSVELRICEPVAYAQTGAVWKWNTPQPENVVTIEVADTGEGIPAEELPFVFDRFRQADGSATRRHEGSGIGLALVKEYIELHHAEICVTSTVGTGTTFKIHLPMGKDHFDMSKIRSLSDDDKGETQNVEEQMGDYIRRVFDPGPTEKETSTEAGESKEKILVVDDNEDMRQFLKSGLGRYSVYEAQNGMEAIEMTKRIKPDLIVCDIMMPEMDGYEFCKRLLDDKETGNIPLIFLTAKTTSDEEKMKGLTLGAIDYIFKPFSIAELASKVASILRQKRMQKLLSEKDRFDTVGVLFGGLSHEILNPLGGIHAHVENLESLIEELNADKKETIGRYFHAIYRNLGRIENLVKNFRALFYTREIKTESMDKTRLHKIISSGMEIVSDATDHRVTTTLSIKDGVTLAGNEEALSHIMINLIRNAAESITGRGEVSVTVKQEDGVPVISVKDTGCGIGEGLLEKIFDPFFTTKDIGKGLGLGLYFVKNLIMKLRWDISVRSKPGAGSEFIIRGKR